MTEHTVSSSKKEVWTYDRSIFLAIIAVDILAILILLFIYFDQLSRIEKVVGTVWAAIPPALILFRVKKGKERSLAEFIGLPPTQMIIVIYSLAIYIFFIFTQDTVHTVIVTTLLDKDTISGVAISWNEEYIDTTDTTGTLVFDQKYKSGSYALECELKPYRPKHCTIHIGIFPLTIKTTQRFKFEDMMRGNLYVRSEPPGAEIWLKKEGRTKIVTTHILTNETVPDLPVGEYSIELRKKDYRTVKGTLTIKADTTITFNRGILKLTGSVYIKDSSGADIYINGEWTHKTSRDRVKFVKPIGKCEIELRKKHGTDYGHRWDTTFTIKDNKVHTIGKQLYEDPAKELYPLFIVTDPQAEIRVNGKNEGMTNRQPIYLFKGDYYVRLSRQGYNDEVLPATMPGAAYHDTIKLIRKAE